MPLKIGAQVLTYGASASDELATATLERLDGEVKPLVDARTA